MLRVRRCCIALGIIWCAVWVGTAALAQGNEAVMTAQRASSLSGVVIDMMGAPTADVAVAECSTDFKDCATVAHSDKNGHFSVHSTRVGKVHYLRFDLPGMDEGRVTVTLSRYAKKLTIQLVVGT
jgi:hypothetical protein